MLLVFLTFFIQPHDLKKTCKNSAGIIFFRRKHHFHRTQMVAPIYSLNLMYHPTTGCDTPFSSTALGKSCFSVRKGASQLGIRGPIPMSRYSPYTYLQHSLNWGQVYIYILYIYYIVIQLYMHIIINYKIYSIHISFYLGWIPLLSIAISETVSENNHWSSKNRLIHCRIGASVGRWWNPHKPIKACSTETWLCGRNRNRWCFRIHRNLRKQWCRANSQGNAGEPLKWTRYTCS